jgi:transcriptional regulator with XRE-family HTH domain
VGKDWTAVAAALSERLDDRDMSMTELSTRSGVSMTTVREIVHGLAVRRRQPRVLSDLSTALGWPPGQLAEILRGRPGPAHPAPGVMAQLRGEVTALRVELRELRDRVDRLEADGGPG